VSRKPCNACPFRIGSSFGYDDDALFALGGSDPSCHQIVGSDQIFAKPATAQTRCVGYDRWEAGVEGFGFPTPAPMEQSS